VIDESDIRAFLAERYAGLVAAVTLACGDASLAEDSVQEAIVRAWERSERDEPIERLDAWVATAALNLTRSGIRRRMAERRARKRLIEATPVADVSPDRVDVTRALAALPRRQRDAVVLRYFLELTTAETAEAMGTSEGTVKSQLWKARTHLESALALDTDEEEHHADA
jgi:RNA polymerase sigma-70 factor (ECF subfamily)